MQTGMNKVPHQWSVEVNFRGARTTGGTAQSVWDSEEAVVSAVTKREGNTTSKKKKNSKCRITVQITKSSGKSFHIMLQ